MSNEGVNSHKNLISDFCSLEGDKSSRLSEIERLTLLGGDGLEKIFRGLAKSVLSLSFKQIFNNLDKTKIEQAYDFYINTLDKKQLFKSPQGIISPKIIPVHGIGDEGEILDIEFESSYQPLHPSYSTIQKTIPENKNVRVRFWRHHQTTKPTIVCVHGWTMNDARANALSFLPGMYFKLGFDVVMFELPFHGRRLNSEFRDAGHILFPSANLILTNEACFQSISDLRQLKLVLRALGVRSVGALGISLGSYLTTLWASIEELKFNVGLLPFSSFGNVAAHHAKNDGVGENNPMIQQIRQIFNLHSIDNQSIKTKSSNFMFAYSSEDSVIPSTEIESLKLHYQDATFLKVDGDHTISDSRDLISEKITSFLKSI